PDEKISVYLAKVREELAAYRAAFESTSNRGLEIDDPRHIEGLLTSLEELIEGYRQATQSASPANISIGLNPKLDEQYHLRIKAALSYLGKTSDDLRDAIRGSPESSPSLGLTRRIEESQVNYQTSLIILIATSTVGLILMFSLGRAFYRWIHAPVRDLHQGVQHLTRGEFQHRIEVHSGDEMEELAAAFNDMTQRLHDVYADLSHQVNERSRQLVRSERLASVGFLAAGVAHEINNPLASIAFCSEALE